jgi:death-on-curing protein
MRAIVFLTKEDLLLLHKDSIETWGGSHGVRDHGLLESALAQPQMTLGEHFAHKDIFEMAAAYLYHLVQNHPFHDGNKRTGAYAAILFLGLNDIRLADCQDELEVLVMETAQGKAKKPEIAEFCRANQVQASQAHGSD